MKCIRKVVDGRVVRVSDKEALARIDRRIAVSHWKYTTRSMWRAAGKVDEKPGDNRASSVHPRAGWRDRSNLKPRWAA